AAQDDIDQNPQFDSLHENGDERRSGRWLLSARGRVPIMQIDPIGQSASAEVPNMTGQLRIPGQVGQAFRCDVGR
ncbi:MAG: hypothetical protein P4L86_19180, partial [Mycobacterium sp.]|nr:hypothetical protein [Mycobacterium sp.]